MKKELSETSLIRAIKDRSCTAAEHLYDRYAHSLFKVICCSANNPTSAELALEQTLVMIWNNIHDFDAKNSTFLIWMAGIARTRSKTIFTDIVQAPLINSPRLSKSEITPLTTAFLITIP